MRRMIAGVALLCAGALHAEVPSPKRPVTDPKAIASPANAKAKPVPIDDLGFTRGLLSAEWSADGTQLFVSTNLTGRYNIWRTDARGSWPVQLTQSDDRQSGLVVSRDGATLFFNQDKGGDEQFDVYAVPTAGGAPVNLTATPDVREEGQLLSPDGKMLALTYKPKAQGQTDLALLDLATRNVRVLVHQDDPQWDWRPVAFTGGGRTLIADRVFTDGSVAEVWSVDVASGKATRLLGKPRTFYAASDATPDGATLAVTSDEGTGQKHAGLYTVAAGTFRWLKPTIWEQTAGAISPDGKWMVAETGVDGRSSLALVDVATAAERALPLPPGSMRSGWGSPAARTAAS